MKRSVFACLTHFRTQNCNALLLEVLMAGVSM